MKVLNPKIVKRWNDLVNCIGIEFEELPESADAKIPWSEIVSEKKYYDIEDGVTYGWMKREAEYWLSCYYERGHCRCDDRFGDPVGQLYFRVQNFSFIIFKPSNCTQYLKNEKIIFPMCCSAYCTVLCLP